MPAPTLNGMSLYALKRLRKELLAEIRKREQHWRRDRRRKYGNMTKAFSPKELREFLSNVPTMKYRVLFTMMALAGLRVHEACQFQWDRVDWDAKKLYVYSEKTSRTDEVPLSEELERVLTYWFGQKSDSPYLFPGDQLAHVSPALVGKRFREAADRSGLSMRYCTDARGYKRRRLSTHSLRHFFVTMVQRNSQNLELTRRLARHVNATTTTLYLHPTEEELRGATDIHFLNV